MLIDEFSFLFASTVDTPFFGAVVTEDFSGYTYMSSVQSSVEYDF